MSFLMSCLYITEFRLWRAAIPPKTDREDRLQPANPRLHIKTESVHLKVANTFAEYEKNRTRIGLL